MELWTGRTDGEGPGHARWHQLVTGEEPAGEHITLLGFRSDEGVRRNLGEPGAAKGPDALRRALAPMALHGRLGRGEVAIVDGGDTSYAGTDLESGHQEMGVRIGEALGADGNLLTVVLGGGHETAWASYLGLMTAGMESGTRWGVLNLDAHFDLRDAPRATSGTPFRQMATAQAALGEEFRYAVAGISQHSNTGVLFDRAHHLGVEYLLDVDCSPERMERFVAEFAAHLDVLYLTVDLDVLPASVAPGVSAPAALGVEPGTVVAAVRTAAGTGKLRLMDVVELNPDLDIQGSTARVGARLIAEAVAVVGSA